jgi:hypothetical protein
MPDKVAATNPSPGLLQKLFGSSEMSPEIKQAIDIARGEDPSLANVSMYGPISRMLLPNAQGYTSPGKNIYLNPNQLQGMNSQDIADTILHEQQHVKQMRERGGNALTELYKEARGSKEPYNQRPDEMAAFQFEKDRRARMGRMQTATPAFDPKDGFGGYIMPQDVYLPSKKKK